MLNSAKPMAFVATKDAVRAKVFYEEVLGLSPLNDDSFALVFDANETMLRVARVQDFSPAAYAVLGWEVPDIKEAVEGLAQRGAIFERYEGIAQDEQGICTFPDGTKVAWFKDPDGNILSLTEFNP